MPILKKKVSLPFQIAEGWGICDMENGMAISDGTNRIYFVDYTEEQIKIKSFIEVKNQSNHTYSNLNELEYAYGFIFANIWLSNKIVIINPKDGNVVK